MEEIKRLLPRVGINRVYLTECSKCCELADIIENLLSRIHTLEEGIKEFLKYSEHTNILSPLRTKLQKLLEEKGETENAM